MTSARALAGQVVTFAGRLLTLARKDAVAQVARLGGSVETEVTERTTLLVVAADASPPGAAAGGQAPHVETDAHRKLRLAAEFNGREPGRIRVVSEDEFCTLVGRVTPTALRQQYYALTTIRSLYPAVRDDHLRYLEKWGLVRAIVRTPGEVYYGFSDVSAIKQANDELGAGTPFRTVLRSLVSARSGQLALDFRPPRSDAPQAKVVTLPARSARAKRDASVFADMPPLAPAEAKFLEGERLEESEAADVETAMAAYREALRLDPTLVPAMINLGNLHYAFDRLPEAQALYVQAALESPRSFEAHFNLGNVFHDLGRYPQAVTCYREAIQLNPAYADAHFYLAVTLEKLGRSPEARPHWRRYRDLSPDGEWVDLAREFGE